MFEGTFLRDQKILAAVQLTNAMGVFPANYDMPLGWAKPSWGNWQVMDAWVTDVHRIASMAPGYCYGKRVMYTVKAYYANTFEDLYDSNMKLWKILNIGWVPDTNCLHPEWGKQGYMLAGGSILEQYWDVQSDHMSHVTSAGQDGVKGAHGDCYTPQYDSISKYSTPGGLMQIMQ
jgi:hypothetical protein